ncbi:MAG: 2-C-methyl-D-erythritol 4-phosphate cytidylyltransferase [Bacteroidales bacterium]|jgi:2-C-methyl-D-erythritol 4-phosphate cytidylyltransferase|nr:2-C-methyl-D-erythritol 4-phosphate cytidylyltransferase [Bacteroidales bacterium]
MKLYALIVAGGRGRRMGTDIPKQYLEIAGKPVLMHTIERFFTYDQSVEIIIVLPGDQLMLWDELQEKYSFNIPHEIVKGGTTRFFSVKNGLESIDSQGLVAIHDGVRPLVSIDTIKRCFETAEKLGNAIPVTSPADTLRILTSNGNASVDRMQIKLIQTPQVFRTSLIKKAYQQNYLPEFTDDATVLEKTGERINLVEGNRENIKITNPEDLIIAQSLFTIKCDL